MSDLAPGPAIGRPAGTALSAAECSSARRGGPPRRRWVNQRSASSSSPSSLKHETEVEHGVRQARLGGLPVPLGRPPRCRPAPSPAPEVVHRVRAARRRSLLVPAPRPRRVALQVQQDAEVVHRRPRRRLRPPAGTSARPPPCRLARTAGRPEGTSLSVARLGRLPKPALGLFGLPLLLQQQAETACRLDVACLRGLAQVFSVVGHVSHSSCVWTGAVRSLGARGRPTSALRLRVAAAGGARRSHRAGDDNSSQLGGRPRGRARHPTIRRISRHVSQARDLVTLWNGDADPAL